MACGLWLWCGRPLSAAHSTYGVFPAAAHMAVLDAVCHRPHMLSAASFKALLWDPAWRSEGGTDTPGAPRDTEAPEVPRGPTGPAGSRGVTFHVTETPPPPQCRRGKRCSHRTSSAVTDWRLIATCSFKDCFPIPSRPGFHHGRRPFKCDSRTVIPTCVTVTFAPRRKCLHSLC